jgi:hypothetical protein
MNISSGVGGAVVVVVAGSGVVVVVGIGAVVAVATLDDPTEQAPASNRHSTLGSTSTLGFMGTLLPESAGQRVLVTLTA